jgi:hypothetical protein
VELAFQALRINDRVVGGIGVDQAEIDKDLAAVNQSGLNALQNDSL